MPLGFPMSLILRYRSPANLRAPHVKATTITGGEQSISPNTIQIRIPERCPHCGANSWAIEAEIAHCASCGSRRE